MTAALWTRGALQHEFGVAPSDMQWYMERTRDFSHAGATAFQAPRGIDLHYIPPDKSIASMLSQGDLDAALVYIPALTDETTVIDRSRTMLRGDQARWLFADRDAEQRRYHTKVGFVPMNHCVVVRAEVLERHPWVAINLYRAFVEAKEASRARTRAELSVYRELGVLTDAATVLDADPFPYGIRANAKALDTLVQYSVEQGLTNRAVSQDEIFAVNVLNV
jgi:4,5-dihydroxyphthalate decarboxylase